MVVLNRLIALAVARPESGADGEDGRWGRNGMTARRTASPGDQRRRGRALRPAEAAITEIYFVIFGPWAGNS